MKLNMTALIKYLKIKLYSYKNNGIILNLIETQFLILLNYNAKL